MPSKIDRATHFYDYLAPHFAQLSNRRRAYLSAVEELIISQIPHSSRSLLDVGAGDGARASRIAHGAGIENLVLLEPSPEMRKNWPPSVEHWPIPAEQLCDKQASFDVITCLWNVLGHISPAGNRAEVLRHCARLLSPEGLLFVDVNYRYNARHYRIAPTLLRMLHDLIHPNVKNGDVTVRWNLEGSRYTTKGHVFTQREFRRMATSAGLTIVKQFTVDYDTGKLCRQQFTGNPLYVLRRADNASPNA